MLKRKTAHTSSMEDEVSLIMKENESLNDEDPDHKLAGSGLKGDRSSIALLLFLYILQGIPLGLGGSIPLILQNRKVSYTDQAVFSFAHWPFSIKLLWAPVVDSIYSSQFGRRKSWLVPSQYMIGLFMIILSYYINYLLGEGSDLPPNVYTLTFVFFMLNFLAATQDIAVDGWALTMLSRKNVGYASTCNTVGQTAGYFIGNVVLLALESPTFSNKYVRTVPENCGMVTLAGYLFFWGIVFLVTTTIVMLLKGERSDDTQEGLMGTYKQLLRILCLPSVLSMVAVLLTSKIAFAATDTVTALKLVEAGVPKEHLAMMAVPLVPVQILMPILIGRYTGGPKPLAIFLKAYPFRCLFGIVFAGLVFWTPMVKAQDGTFPIHYYITLIFFYALQQCTVYCIYVSMMAFFAKISDPSIGGTYMTLMNTVSNLGGNWPGTVSLWFMEYLTIKACFGEKISGTACKTSEELKICTDAGSQCVIERDGYYIETTVCVIIGFLWLLWGRRRINYLQKLHMSAWTTK